jgi:hypothetical protein
MVWGSFENEVNIVVDKWKPELEDFKRKQEELEEQTFNDLIEMALDGILVDGETLRNKLNEQPKNFNKKARNIRDFAAPMIMADDATTTTDSNVEIPLEKEINDAFDKLFSGLDSMAPKYEEADRDAEAQY